MDRVDLRSKDTIPTAHAQTPLAILVLVVIVIDDLNRAGPLHGSRSNSFARTFKTVGHEGRGASS